MSVNLYTNIQEAIAQGAIVCMAINVNGNEISTGELIYGPGMTAPQVVDLLTKTMPISSSGTTLG